MEKSGGRGGCGSDGLYEKRINKRKIERKVKVESLIHLGVGNYFPVVLKSKHGYGSCNKYCILYYIKIKCVQYMIKAEVFFLVLLHSVLSKTRPNKLYHQ